MNPNMTVEKKPPINPSQVFLGDNWKRSIIISKVIECITKTHWQILFKEILEYLCFSTYFCLTRIALQPFSFTLWCLLIVLISKWHLTLRGLSNICHTVNIFVSVNRLLYFILLGLYHEIVLWILCLYNLLKL